jgi:ribonuclease HI
MSKKQKFYVVWSGRQPGIYDNWDDCNAQVKGFTGAKYKSFESKGEAEAAYRQQASSFIKPRTTEKSARKTASSAPVIWESICVDAACSGNPGVMEYRGVDTSTGREIFRQGPFSQATNNIGEFLAIVHALAMLQQQGASTRPIYSDSRTAISWVRNVQVKTKLEPTPANRKVFDLLERALLWLKSNTFRNPILKWETEIWGEIPADFGRK